MRCTAMAGGLQRGLALVSDRGAQHRRLADDAEPGSMGPMRHVVDQRAYAKAADFLVVGEGKLQRQPQRTGRGAVRCPQRARQKTLHVRRSARKQARSALLQSKWIGSPVLAVHRHHIGVPGQQHAAPIRWADTGVQVGLASGGIAVQPGFDAALRQKIAHVFDQCQVRFAADGRKADEPIENLYAVHRRTAACCSPLLERIAEGHTDRARL